MKIQAIAEGTSCVAFLDNKNALIAIIEEIRGKIYQEISLKKEEEVGINSDYFVYAKRKDGKTPDNNDSFFFSRFEEVEVVMERTDEIPPGYRNITANDCDFYWVRCVGKDIILRARERGVEYLVHVQLFFEYYHDGNMNRRIG